MLVNDPKLGVAPELLLAEGNLSRGSSPNPQDTSPIFSLDEGAVVFKEHFRQKQRLFLLNICKGVTVTAMCLFSLVSIRSPKSQQWGERSQPECVPSAVRKKTRQLS